MRLRSIKERWQSGRMRRSRKPLSCLRGTGGSNPPFSAKTKQTMRWKAHGFCFQLKLSQARLSEDTAENKIPRTAGFALSLPDSRQGITTERREVVIPAFHVLTPRFASPSLLAQSRGAGIIEIKSLIILITSGFALSLPGSSVGDHRR
jgi:hypothetical protein